MVFASTVSGYEGNGRGFEIKFLPELEKLYPQWKAANITTPYRWKKNDPLERAFK